MVLRRVEVASVIHVVNKHVVTVHVPHVYAVYDKRD